MAIRLEVALGRLPAVAGIKALELLLSAVTKDKERAAIGYEMWRLDKDQEDIRQQTAEWYHNLYASTPNITYRQRYQELTGQALPASPTLPELPTLITATPVHLDALLAQVDQLLSEAIAVV